MDLNVYVTFVMNVVVGYMDQADALMRQEGARVRKMARYFSRKVPPDTGPLYRGWLVEPERVSGSWVEPDYDYQFMSFTSEYDVACLFADPRSAMSSFVAAHRPTARGFVMEYADPDQGDVLWTYKWEPMPFDKGRLISVPALIGSKPGFEQQAQIVQQNIANQREVVMLPIQRDAEATMTPIERADCPPTEELERTYGGGGYF
jgi:hypothetical protein